MRGKNDGIVVYIPKEATLKEMAAKIEQVKPAFLSCPSPGTFRYTSCFKQRFPGRWIDRGGPLHYPPISQNLNLLYFYLWAQIEKT
jgi:hypothetical protein